MNRVKTPIDGSIVVALLDDEFTLKRFRQRGSRICLHPENPAFPNIEILKPERDERSVTVAAGRLDGDPTSIRELPRKGLLTGVRVGKTDGRTAFASKYGRSKNGNIVKRSVARRYATKIRLRRHRDPGAVWQ